MEASTSPTKPVSSGSAQPPPAGAPIKLTFKLGASVNPSTSSVATPSPPASEPMEYSFSGGDFDRDESMSEVGSTLGTTAPGSDAVPGVGEVVKEKPKRKRAPKRPSGEIGPGKHWRKGMKGNLAGVGLQVPIPAPPPIVYPYGAGPPPLIPSRSHIIGPAPKIATAFLPPLALETRTPKPRKWSKVVKELTSITGMPLHFRSWQGRSASAYFDARAAAAALGSPAPFPAATADHSTSPSGSPAPPGPPATLQFSANPRPLPAPNFTSNKDPKAGAQAAAAAFRARKTSAPGTPVS